MFFLLLSCDFKVLGHVTVFTVWDLLCCVADSIVWVCFLCKTNPVCMVLFLPKAVFGPLLF